MVDGTLIMALLSRSASIGVPAAILPYSGSSIASTSMVDLAAGQRAGEIALDDVGLELRPFRGALLTAGAGFRPFGQLQHFKRPRAVGQAADEAALLKAGDQPVDAGLGLEAKRILHLIEGRRDSAFTQPVIDEEQKFVLFTCQHLRPLRATTRSGTKHKH